MNNLKRFGTGYGGFFYPENLDGLNHDSIIYCVGAGEDISHDIELAHKLNSDVFIFDPTPRAIEHINYIKKLLEGQEEFKPNPAFGGGAAEYLDLIIKSRIDSNKIYFYDYGLHTENIIAKFYKPSNEEYVSHSVIKGMKSDNYINVKMKTLKTIMEELKHDNVDLLKIDIEGVECDVLEQMIHDNIYPKYLSVDFDLGWTGEKIQNRERCFETINSLKTVGYEILHQGGADFSFVLSK